MRAMRAQTRHQLGIIGNNENEPALLRDPGQSCSQMRTTHQFARANHDEAPTRQAGRGGDWIGQTLVIRHQHERRQPERVETARFV
jgi:hypothetical protein